MGPVCQIVTMTTSSYRPRLIQALRRTLRSIEEQERLAPEDANLRELKRSIVQTLAELDSRSEKTEAGELAK